MSGPKAGVDRLSQYLMVLTARRLNSPKRQAGLREEAIPAAGVGNPPQAVVKRVGVALATTFNTWVSWVCLPGPAPL